MKFPVSNALVLSAFLIHFGLPAKLEGHSVPVHRKVADAAAQAAPDFNEYMETTFGPGKAPLLDGKTPIGWIIEGAEREDDSPRFYNHFYNPFTAGGLTDLRFVTALLYQSFPVSSKNWGTGDDVKGIGGPNRFAFGSARLYEYYALTDQSKTAREQYFGQMFRSLGQVVHLITDLSQPGHTRNDAHGLSQLKNYIESYGEERVNDLPYTQESLDWQAAGFKGITDFWDRYLYHGDAQSLDGDGGDNTLGLSEFTNGNFLSEDSVYNEMAGVAANHIFPLPSLTTSTNYLALKDNVLGGIKQTQLADGTFVTKLYLSKLADGIPVEHHAAVKFFGYKHLKLLKPLKMSQGGVTLNDEAVLAEYHSILIPAAVKYSAGALDYFCRGKLGLRITWDEEASNYHLEITNESTAAFAGGAFKLYSDDTTGIEARWLWIWRTRGRREVGWRQALR